MKTDETSYKCFFFFFFQLLYWFTYILCVCVHVWVWISSSCYSQCAPYLPTDRLTYVCLSVCLSINNLFQYENTSFWQFNCCESKFLHSPTISLFRFLSYFLTYSPPLFLCSSSLPPSKFLCCLSRDVYHFLFFSLKLSCSLASFSFLMFSFEVLNRKMASLPSNLVGKSNLKLQYTVQHSSIKSLWSQEGGKEVAASDVSSTCSDNDSGCSEPWSSKS